MWILWCVLAVIVLYLVFQWGAASGQGKILYWLKRAYPEQIEETLEVMREVLKEEKWYVIPLMRPTLYYVDAYEFYYNRKEKEDS